jgi:hypothetical protein
MRKIVFFIFFALLFMGVESQEKKNFTEAKEFFLNPSGLSREKTTIPFKKVIIKDFRFDTTKLGYVINKGISRIVIKENPSSFVTKTINEYFKNNLDITSDKSLLIIIKSFWFQQGAFDLVANDKIISKDAGYTDRAGVCFTDFELFSFSNDSYQAFMKFRYDFVDYKYNTQSLLYLFYIPFDSLLEKIHATNVEQVLSNKRKLSWSRIDSNYKNRYNLPVLANGIMEKGVFLSFEDFKNMKVNYPDFQVKKSNITDELYVKSNDKEEILTDFWGYCDGKNYYIRVGYNFFKLYRQNNTFDLFGSKYINTINTDIPVPITPGGLQGNLQLHKNKLDSRPLQLNMDSGLTY